MEQGEGYITMPNDSEDKNKFLDLMVVLTNIMELDVHGEVKYVVDEDVLTVYSDNSNIAPAHLGEDALRAIVENGWEYFAQEGDYNYHFVS